ncbi:MAG: F0F1 ATP synthase subunit B [Verrucomicrobia bacterium]|nr:F0F1 ATP synthase subunit B [Verrucomicrobiota bacterium]
MIPIILATETHAPSFFEQFGVDWPHFIAQLLTMLVVLYVLNRYAYKPLLDLLEERRRRIAESMAQAEQVKQELAKAQEAREKIIADAGKQAQQLIDEARAAAQRQGDQQLQQAIAQAEALIAKAREATDLDRQRMLTELKHEVGRLVVETTAKVTGKVLTPDDQRRLAEETAKQLAA